MNYDKMCLILYIHQNAQGKKSFIIRFNVQNSEVVLPVLLSTLRRRMKRKEQQQAHLRDDRWWSQFEASSFPMLALSRDQ